MEPNNAPEIRTSMDDEQLGVVLATAGLYEIEELIAEIQEDDPFLEKTFLCLKKPSRRKTMKLSKKEDTDSTDDSSPKSP